MSERIIIDLVSMPSGVAANVIQGTVNDKYVDYINLAFDDADKVVFTGSIATGESVTIKVRAIYAADSSYETFAVTGKVSGDKLTLSDILASITGYDSEKYSVVSVKQFGADYFATEAEEIDGVSVTCRQYIEVTYGDNSGGAVIELIDGVMTVTGFDSETANGDQGTGYTVTIPSTYNGVAVTAIAAGAFKDETGIVAVNIPASVTNIGAEAFMNTTNLANVNITPGGLSVIGRSAFENSGFTTIALPLANLTDVQPYAFKSDKLVSFTAVSGEENLCIGADILFESSTSPYASYLASAINAGLEIPALNSELEGKYIFLLGSAVATSQTYNGFQGLAVYKGITQDGDRYCIDVDFIAIAGATPSYFVSLGQDCLGTYYVRYEVMEGSVYGMNNIDDSDSAVSAGITFTHVSKVHADAFTDLPENFGTVKREATADKEGAVYGVRVTTYFTKDNFDNADIFEDGWWLGVTADSENYSQIMNFTDNVPTGSPILSFLYL